MQISMAAMARRKRPNAAACSNAMTGCRKRIELCSGLPGGTVTKIHGGGADVARGDPVKVTLVCCKATGHVLFLEAGDSFVEILLSFLVLPVGSIVKLLAKEGVSGGLNGISSILDSLESFSELMPYVDKLTYDLGAPPSSMDSPQAA